MKISALLLLLTAAALVIPPHAKAAEPAVVGTWDCVSETPDGGEYKFTLTVKHEDGKFTAIAGTEEGDMAVGDIKVDGDDVSFKATVGEEDYSVTIKVNGSKFEGKWSGGDESGSIKGSKHA
ncbi:MAG TPA: hypothetical protein VHD76_17460 [Bryobacteraceae bacterium]|jgi:hypothetical protein|nr:hypothetical protein [Bryobacteraceae bacterium]